MEKFVNLINLLKEYVDTVYPDYDRETVYVELPKKFYQDLLLKLDKLEVEIILKTDKNKNEYNLVLSSVSFDEFTIDSSEDDEDSD